MMDEDKVERIRASRGYHEAEVSCTGEDGLHHSLIWCKKNPNHRNFIPTNSFNIEHLPRRYRDNLIVDYVRAASDITCRLLVEGISEVRPDTWPDSDKAFPFSLFKGENSTMTGTGWVSDVVKVRKESNLNCQCDECCRPGNTPKKTWGHVSINTACHVVYDDDEASRTTCQFFYDSHETNINKILTLTGLEVVFKLVKGDFCRIKYVTHDVELLDRLDKMWKRWLDLRDKVYKKYLSKKSPRLCAPGVGCDTNVDHNLCIIVSHPHGCSKVVTVGVWTQRQLIETVFSLEPITYSYNTHTCPGSSGAPVITLYKNIGTKWSYDLPAHSQGRPGNDNNSGFTTEWL